MPAGGTLTKHTGGWPKVWVSTPPGSAPTLTPPAPAPPHACPDRFDSSYVCVLSNFEEAGP